MTSNEAMLKAFWEGHDPTQGMRQGNDIGTQYRSGIYVADEDELALATSSRDMFQAVLDRAGLGPITTENLPGRALLLRRGLSPAVPAQGPMGLLRLGQHRSDLPGWGCNRRLSSQAPDRSSIERVGERFHCLVGHSAPVLTPRQRHQDRVLHAGVDIGPGESHRSPLANR